MQITDVDKMLFCLYLHDVCSGSAPEAIIKVKLQTKFESDTDTVYYRVSTLYDTQILLISLCVYSLCDDINVCVHVLMKLLLYKHSV